MRASSCDRLEPARRASAALPCSGDRCGRRKIVDRLGAECVAFVRAAVTRLELADVEVDVVLGGGLLQAGNGLIAGIEAGLREVGPRLSMKVARSRPVVGAALAGWTGSEPTGRPGPRARLDRATFSVGDVAGDAASVAELRSNGVTVSHFAIARQRGRNRQPGFGSTTFGGSPTSRASARPRSA